jgi:CNT family concentrative nucleoside transporter
MPNVSPSNRVFLVLVTIFLFVCAIPALAANPQSEATIQAVPEGATPGPLPREERPWSIVSVFRGLMGLCTLLGLAWLMSLHRKKMPWRLVFGAVAMQILLGLFLIKWDIGYELFDKISGFITKLLDFSNQGAEFVFGSVVTGPSNGAALAFKALPTIVFFSCLMAVLYHLRVMHYLILALARVMNRFLGVTGAESMAMAANIFVGQTEAPLVVRRFVPKMTKSELMSLMTGGFATVAGSVLAAYIAMLQQGGGGEYIPHLLIASVMSAPAAFAISKVIIPETEKSETGEGMPSEFKPAHDNLLDAAASGTTEGLQLWLNVFAMLLAFTAMVALINYGLGGIGNRIGVEGLSLELIFGRLLAPLAYMMGVEWADATSFGSLLGIKIGVNEFIAYLGLQQEIVNNVAGVEGAMSKRSLFMATYALCGFANFASIGIQIGGISPMAPERRGEIISLALRAMLGGALASWMTASIAGMFY